MVDRKKGRWWAGGGPQICTGILIVLSTSDEGDGSKWPEPPSGSGCAMIYESQAHIRFQCKIFKINKCLIQNYIYSEGSLKAPSSESPIMRIGLLWSCRLIFKKDFFNPVGTRWNLFSIPAPSEAFSRPSQAQTWCSELKILSQTLNEASGVHDPCAIAD